MTVDLRCDRLSYSFGSGPARVGVFSALSLRFSGEEFCVITGPSGSGKTTLLSLLCLAIPPDSGRILFGGKCVSGRSREFNDRFRRETIGLMFQTSRLIPALSVREQLGIVSALRCREGIDGAIKMLERLGMDGCLDKLPYQLSGGEKQRVALAQCFLSEAKIILADEPSASIDTETTVQLVQVLKGHAKKCGAVVVVTTHDPLLINAADMVVKL